MVFLCTGIILGALYDILYVFRKKRKGIMLHISDLMFGVIFFILTALTVQIFNSGNLHWYMFFAIFLGFCAERATLGKFIKISIDFFAKFLYNLYIRLNLKQFFARIMK